MNKLKFSIAAFVILSLVSCGSSKKSVIPLSAKVLVEDTYTIIWNGISEAYAFKNGNWQRAEAYDYQFDVIQKRYDNKWKSVKSLHRIHPDYDGKAGERDQTMYFDVSYNAGGNGAVNSQILSSIGDGTGSTDWEYRNAELVMYVKDAGMFMPYNKIRINQKYYYEQGLLTETVELLKEKEGKETPFMKNEEKAYFYLKGKLNQAPTVFKN
jgi:hypothetical protein